MISPPDSKKNSWRDSLKAFTRPSAIAMLFFGFSAGTPILLIFSSLSLWLREAGVSRADVTYFSWAALGYSFKFVWAPLPDRLPIPFLTKKLGRRRSWILLSQLAIMLAILLMAYTDPAAGGSALKWMAIGAVLLGFSSATQDIVIDAYRIESDTEDMQALLSATYIAGYRIGMIVAGAGALLLASTFGTKMGAYSYDSWFKTYTIMALTMLVGVLTTLCVKEPFSPTKKAHQQDYTSKDYSQFFMLFLAIILTFIATLTYSAPLFTPLKEAIEGSIGTFLSKSLQFTLGILTSALVARILVSSGLVNKSMVNQTYIEPIKDFFNRYGRDTALLLLALVGLYRISDIVLGVISNVFYQDLGFTKVQIASVVKTFGLIMTLIGGFLGGLLTTRFSIIKILMLGAILSAATNILFILLAKLGDNTLMLYVVISTDNLAAGLASAAFIAFLSSLTNISFTAIQYAIFSSLMTLFPKLLGGYSGTLAENLGYEGFFMVSALMGLPVLYLVYLAGKKLDIRKD